MPVSRQAAQFAGVALLAVGAIAAGLGLTPAKAANESNSGESSVLNLFSSQNEVTALFHVSSENRGLLTKEDRGPNWEIFSRTQLAYLHSYFVLQSALRDPSVSQLPLIKDQPNPVAWLNSQLDVGFYADSEAMYIKMRGSAADKEQLRAIVNAVCDAYLKETVFEEEQRQLVVRDALQRSFTNLGDEIRNKTDSLNALARDLGAAETDGKARVMQDLDLKRIERIETELLRLEDEQLAAKVYAEQKDVTLSPKERAQLVFFDKRIEELSKRQTEFEERIVARNQSSVELELGARELKLLQSIAADMSRRLEEMDVESIAPKRIRLIQKAT
jgi:hypothetical protein